MPKKMNTDKAAAAVCQNARAIQEAMRTRVGTFGAVTKALGNRAFEIQLRVAEKGQRMTVQATPRALFQGGKKAPIRISVGHVVLLAGEVKVVGEGVQRPLEIVARLDSRKEIRELIEMGLMSSAVLGIAETAGAVETAAMPLAKDKLFNEEDEDDDAMWTAGLQEAKGGLKQQRQAAETVATIASRVAILQGQKEGRRKGVDGYAAEGKALTTTKGGAHELLNAELTAEELTPAQQAEFIRWRAAKHVIHSARMAAGGGGPHVTVAQVEYELKVAAQTAQSAAEQAAVRQEMDSAARVEELREFLGMRKVAENWDDVDLDDL